jgi:hypothetical protein
MRKAFQRRDLDVIFDLDPGDEYPEKVSSLLHGLCDTLDGRVNPDLPHLHRVQGVKYPNLDALLRRLQSRRFGKKVCTRLYEQKRAFLFTVLAGKDTDETQKPLAEFNSFVDGCKLWYFPRRIGSHLFAPYDHPFEGHRIQCPDIQESLSMPGYCRAPRNLLQLRELHTSSRNSTSAASMG